MEHDPLDLVREACDTLAVKAAHMHDGIADRDAAICDAYDAGVSAIQIAEVAGISRQQVHKIVSYRDELHQSV